MKPTEKTLEFADRAAWRAWLQTHHAQGNAAWLLFPRKKAAKGKLTLEEAVEEALCFGWIDGLLRSVDTESYCLRFSQRRPGSIWSSLNKQRAKKLIRQGQMTAAGLEKTAEARANGEWQAATDREDTQQIPPDLETALKQHKAAWQSFQNWPGSLKKQYIYWFACAKTTRTQQKRIQKIIERALIEESSAGE